MEQEAQAPETLLEAVHYFADADVALEFVANLRWPHGARCPQCASEEGDLPQDSSPVEVPRVQEAVFGQGRDDLRGPPDRLDKWLPAMWMIANCKNGDRRYELARALGITQKSAWFMLHRIRLAMQTGSFEQDRRRRRGRRDLHRRQGAQHAQAAFAQEPHQRHGSGERQGRGHGLAGASRSRQKHPPFALTFCAPSAKRTMHAESASTSSPARTCSPMPTRPTGLVRRLHSRRYQSCRGIRARQRPHERD